MGYAHYEVAGMERGHAVPDTCHNAWCTEQIDRGLDHLCYSCALYFCGKHLTTTFDYKDQHVSFECFAGEGTQCCRWCRVAWEESESEWMTDCLCRLDKSLDG